MGFDRPLGDDEPLRDRRVGMPLGDQREDLLLTLAQALCGSPSLAAPRLSTGAKAITPIPPGTGAWFVDTIEASKQGACRGSSVGQSTALVKRGSRVRIPSPALQVLSRSGPLLGARLIPGRRRRLLIPTSTRASQRVQLVTNRTRSRAMSHNPRRALGVPSTTPCRQHPAGSVH